MSNSVTQTVGEQLSKLSGIRMKSHVFDLR